MCNVYVSNNSQTEPLENCRYGFYLEASILGAEFLPEHGVIGIKGFLLQTAVHQNMNDLSLLLVLQAHPSQQRNQINK